MNVSKIRPWRSPRYLDWVRSRPCAHCGAIGQSQAHHRIGLVGGVMGSKAGDQEAMPLCDACHSDLHAGRIDLEAQVGWLLRTLEVAFAHGELGGRDDG